MHLLSLYNSAQVCSNFLLIYVCIYSTNIAFVHWFAKLAECCQLLDIAVAFVGLTKSNVTTTSIQTIAKSIVVVFGSPTYIRQLGIVWACSDIVRYAYHLLPNICLLKQLRYSQYKLLYPIGISLEIATLLPIIANPYVKGGVLLLYALVSPHMFNTTSVMETKQRILSVLHRGIRQDGECKIQYGNDTYAYDEVRFRNIKQQFSTSRFKWTFVGEKSVVLKDYGIQISWRLVYLIEYFGALVAFPLMIGGGVGRIDTMLWIVHYTKRLVESAFVHSFSSETMPLVNVFKNSAYYWGAGVLLGYCGRGSTIVMDAETQTVVMAWCCCQIVNGYCHWYLANLRTGTTARVHVLPSNLLFRCVVCPNYTTEIMGWALFTILGYNGRTAYVGVKALFCCIGAGQMYVWAGGKRRRYKKLFGDKYKVTGNLLPGV